MNKLFSFYTNYSNNIDEYNNWTQQQDVINNSSYYSRQQLKQKAKAIAEPLLLLDKYEHEKAEDSETFFQTYNIELMSLTAFLSSLPITITKIIPFLNKHNATKKAGQLLSKYNNFKLNIKGKNFSLPQITTAASIVGSGIFYVNGIKNSMKSQLGLIRKASFDATQNIINDPKEFAILTNKQEQEINSISDFEETNKIPLVDKLKEKININSAFQTVNEYKINLSNYQNKKKEYFECTNSNISTDNEDEKQLMNSYLTNVEHAVLEPLRKVETISNISYSALFTGGFLEYLITDKLVDVLQIKNKTLSGIIKLAVPLFTYFVLNKNISNIENKAILATKYKYLKDFIQDPEKYSSKVQSDKQNPISFIKSIYADMKDYNTFEQNELPKLQKRADAKKQINLSQEQEKQAKLLQQNTSFYINKQREYLYNQSVGIKALSETILGPLDIVSTAVGGKIGHTLSKKCQNKKISGILTGLGAVIAFIPAAIIEAKLTKQQKLSEKIAVMLAIKDLNNKSSDSSSLKSKNYNYENMSFSSIFNDFINQKE